MPLYLESRIFIEKKLIKYLTNLSEKTRTFWPTILFFGSCKYATDNSEGRTEEGCSSVLDDTEMKDANEESERRNHKVLVTKFIKGDQPNFEDPVDSRYCEGIRKTKQVWSKTWRSSKSQFYYESRRILFRRYK